MPRGAQRTVGWPKFTWDAVARQYRGENGRFVPRVAVRQALDEFSDNASADLLKSAKQLQANTISLIEFQIRMEASIKSIHTAAVATAAGGWAQATAADWGEAGRKIRQEYGFLDAFARQVADGLPLDGRFLQRAASYAHGAAATYEKALRRNDLAKGLVIREKRLLHSFRPCHSCEGYAAAGWQPAEVLPDIGEECECTYHCQCTFIRQMLKSSDLKFKPSASAKAQGFVTVVVDVAKLDAAFQRDTGFAIGPRGEGAIAGRQAGFRDFLVEAVQGGTKIEQSSVSVAPDGGVAFEDGRHRFSVLRDMGVKQLPISVPKDSVAVTKRRYGAKPASTPPPPPAAPKAPKPAPVVATKVAPVEALPVPPVVEAAKVAVAAAPGPGEGWTVSPEAGKAWAKDSVYKEPLYHRTFAPAKAAIEQDGIDLSKTSGVYGQGLYVSTKPETAFGPETVEVALDVRNPLIASRQEIHRLQREWGPPGEPLHSSGFRDEVVRRGYDAVVTHFEETYQGPAGENWIVIMKPETARFIKK